MGQESVRMGGPGLSLACLSQESVMRKAHRVQERLRKEGGPPKPPLSRTCILPHIAEQSSDGARFRHAPIAVRDVQRRCHCALPGKRSVRLFNDDSSDSEYWNSNFDTFCKEVLPVLPLVAFIVTHGNFMRNEICSRQQCPLPVPNGGVLELRRGKQRVFFIRHCATYHNINKSGSSALTGCQSLDALRAPAVLARACMALYGERQCLIGSSPMPRAVVSALALVSNVTEGERRALVLAFDMHAVEPSPSEIRHFHRKWSCGSAPMAFSPFCNGAQGA